MQYPKKKILSIFALLTIVAFIFFSSSCKKVDTPEEKKSATNIIIPSNKIDTTEVVVPGSPKLFTDTISDLTTFSVILKGKILDQGTSNITESGIVVDTVPKAKTYKNFNKFKLVPDASNQMKTIVTYMPASTNFYIRTYAINAAGVGYGNEIYFKSLPEKGADGNFIVSNQQEVIALGAKNYTALVSLKITGTVTDLSPLKSLNIITSDMEITGTSLLTDLKGLENLEIVGKHFPNSLKIDGNRALKSLNGLKNLKIVNGDFYIRNNPLLTNLIGLEKFTTSQNGEFRVDNCASLLSLDGVESMVNCERLLITKNSLLNDLKALKNLKKIPMFIDINNNGSLTNLQGLENITEVGGGDDYGINIEGNPLLTDLDGLKNVKAYPNITIKSNASLADLSCFENVKYLFGLDVINNASLVNLKGLGNVTNIKYGINITDNGSLASLLGLDKIETIGKININKNRSLKDLQGLNALKTITTTSGYAITIGSNDALTSLTGLEKLAYSTPGIQIGGNKNLVDFCALKLLFNTYAGSFLALNNKIAMDKQILQSTCK